ncbi:uncharacterized protein LOC121718817 isoform X4 [Alosa sapidissima]|uniref:uncharacterized protein LOC121718817 isoform X4 n=1 Tax=Alosa sapidissima TaxID=34773 RepID=UPI001C0858E2|nr:uncharacterized protein LOC121718817 isoform X4 [Alosa sapidissima]
MSGFTEPTLLPMPVKEIKEEEFDDFHQEHLFAVQKEEENPGLDHDCKTETHTSLTFNCKEEKSPLMEIKQEEEKSPLMEIKQDEESDIREHQLIDSSPTELESKMSGFTEPTLLPMPVKEIKEEEFDDFHQEHLFAVQKEEEKPGLDHDCKTETHTSPTFNCKEEKSPLMDIKEEESDSREHDQKDSSTGNLQTETICCALCA